MLRSVSDYSCVVWTSWPNRPPLPSFLEENRAQCFSLLRLPGVTRSEAGRIACREILTGLLSEWAGLPVSLEESELGPTVRQEIRGRRCFFSISYSRDAAWIAIALDARIGVDAVEIEAFEEVTEVERIYLGEGADQEFCTSEDKWVRFAKRWSAMEARFKKAGLPLREYATPPDSRTCHLLHEGTVVAVAFG